MLRAGARAFAELPGHSQSLAAGRIKRDESHISRVCVTMNAGKTHVPRRNALNDS